MLSETKWKHYLLKQNIQNNPSVLYHSLSAISFCGMVCIEGLNSQSWEVMNMTDLQLKYWGLKEEQRHNLVFEQETQRHNVKTEDISVLNLSEVRRHNMTTESLTAEQLGIQARQAQASLLSAQSAYSQAQTAMKRAEADIAYTQSRTQGQEISNVVSRASRFGEIADAYITPLQHLVSGIGNVLGFIQ